MLETIVISQFSGINTQADSANLGVSALRECRNFILRPIGGIGVPASWPRFTCNGTILSLGYINLIDYKFSSTARLLVQADDDNWWNFTPKEADGQPANVIVAAPGGTTISTNLTLTTGQIMAFNYSSGNIRLGAGDVSRSWFTNPIGIVPYATTTYTTDQAFTKGFAPVFTDDSGDKWKLYVDNNTGIYAEPIA